MDKKLYYSGNCKACGEDISKTQIPRHCPQCGETVPNVGRPDIGAMKAQRCPRCESKERESLTAFKYKCRTCGLIYEDTS